MIPYYSCIILFFASLHIILFSCTCRKPWGSEGGPRGMNMMSARDSLDVAVAEVDEATLPSLPLPLPLASPPLIIAEYESLCPRVCGMRNVCAHGARMAPPLSCSILTHYSRIILFYKRTYYSQRNSRIMCGGLLALTSPLQRLAMGSIYAFPAQFLSLWLLNYHYYIYTYINNSSVSMASQLLITTYRISGV